MTNVEQRQEWRYPTEDTVQIRIVSSNENLTGKILEVSRSGLQLEVDVALPIRTHLEILTRGKLAIFGEVRHCRKVGDHFRAGVLIHDTFSQKPSNPRHISDDDISLLASGIGLKVKQVLRIRDHLHECSFCQEQLARKRVKKRRVHRGAP